MASRGHACEHLFVSIKGRPYTWLRASLQCGDLLGVRSAAAELPQINLADALAIVLLMAADDDPSYERAATRWLARLASERPSIGLQDLAAAVGALQALGGGATRPRGAGRVVRPLRHRRGHWPACRGLRGGRPGWPSAGVGAAVNRAGGALDRRRAWTPAR